VKERDLPNNGNVFWASGGFMGFLRTTLKPKRHCYNGWPYGPVPPKGCFRFGDSSYDWPDAPSLHREMAGLSWPATGRQPVYGQPL